MNIKKDCFKIIQAPLSSEKGSILIRKTNVITFKVNKFANKIEIKNAIQKIFKIKVKNINTLIMKKKIKNKKNRNYRYSNWKKAYIFLKKGQNFNFIESLK